MIRCRGEFRSGRDLRTGGCSGLGFGGPRLTDRQISPGDSAGVSEIRRLEFGIIDYEPDPVL